ncbi:MAG: hypothetical protein ACFFCE_02980 [Promethearchaeota archaeon]
MENKEKEVPEILKKFKCLVCGTVNAYSKPYKYKQLAERKLLKKIRNKEVLRFLFEVPICFNCKNKFYKWKIYLYISISSFTIGIFNVIFGIFCLVFHQIFEDLGIKIIIIGFLIIFSSLIFRYLIGRIETSPTNYFFYDFRSKIFYVKPSEENDWIPYSIWNKTRNGKS